MLAVCVCECVGRATFILFVMCPIIVALRSFNMHEHSQTQMANKHTHAHRLPRVDGIHTHKNVLNPLTPAGVVLA